MNTLFPTETAGTGKVLPQYLKLSDGQGNGLKLRRVSCRQCGFPGCDLVKHDSSGGSLSGNGAMGTIIQQGSGADGNQAYNRGGGCPLCGSKNYRGIGRRFDEFTETSKFSNVIR